MLRRWRALLALFVFEGLLLAPGGHARLIPDGVPIRAYFFDIDDTLLRLLNYIYLRHRSSGREIGFTSEEFAEVRLLIGSDGRGLSQNYDLRLGGDRIQPINMADYELFEGSLREFGDTHGDHPNYFLKGLLESLRLNKVAPDALGVPRPTWQGSSYDSYNEAVSHEPSRVWTFVNTARQHRRRTIYTGLDMLYQGAQVGGVLPEENIWPVGSPEFPRYFREAFGEDPPPGNTWDPSARKLLVMSKVFDLIEKEREKLPLGPGQFDTAGFSDDDRGNFTKALEGLSPDVARGRWPHIKITLFYVGRTATHKPSGVVLETGKAPRHFSLEGGFRDVDPVWKRLSNDRPGADQFASVSRAPHVLSDPTIRAACSVALDKK